jgi:hypothetical protein
VSARKDRDAARKERDEALEERDEALKTVRTLTGLVKRQAQKLATHHDGDLSCSEALTKARSATDTAVRRATQLKAQLDASDAKAPSLETLLQHALAALNGIREAPPLWQQDMTVDPIKLLREEKGRRLAAEALLYQLREQVRQDAAVAS